MAFVFSFVLDSAGILIIDPSMYIYIYIINKKKRAWVTRYVKLHSHPSGSFPLAPCSCSFFFAVLQYFQMISTGRDGDLHHVNTKKRYAETKLSGASSSHHFRWVTFLQDESAVLPSFCVVQKNSVTTVRGEGYMKVPRYQVTPKRQKWRQKAGFSRLRECYFHPSMTKPESLSLPQKQKSK